MIQFYRGLKTKYNYPENTSLQDAIFFATDTSEIIINGVTYGTDTEKLKDVSFDSATNTLTFVKGTGTNYEVKFGDRLLSDADRTAIDQVKDALAGAGFTAIYDTTLDENLATVTALGGISAGTKVSALKGKKITEVLDTLIFPTVQPTAVDPTVSLSLKSGVANVREIGSALPTAANFSTSWNAGSIKIGNSVQSTRAGEKISESLYSVKGESELPTVVPAGTTNYYYSVTYADGPEPKDSKGNPATSIAQLKGSTITSKAVAVYGVYTFYANKVNSEFASLPLTNATSFEVELAAEGPNKHAIKIPHTITKVELFNTVGNKYEPFDVTKFTKTTEVIDVNGTGVTYNVYTRNDSGFNGTSKFKITYTK